MNISCSQPSPARRLFNTIWPLLLIPTVLTGIFMGYDHPQNWKQVVASWIVNLIVTLGIGGSIVFNYEILFRWLFKRYQRFSAQMALHLLCLVTGVFVGAEIAYRCLDLVFGGAIQGARSGFITIGLVVAFVLMAIELVLERSRVREKQAELQAVELRRESLNAQLQALQSRTNPHFLFNSLNAVASLIQEDPERAERAVERLSEVIRYSLDSSRRSTVPLNEELKAVRGYLDIEHLRFGDRIRTELDFENEIQDLPIPPLILQPLVENAVLHGVASQREGGRVEIRGIRANGSLLLSVEDDGPGAGKSKHRGNQMGLEDLRERLRLMYGEKASLETYDLEPTGFGVKVRLPYAEDTEATV